LEDESVNLKVATLTGLISLAIAVQVSGQQPEGQASPSQKPPPEITQPVDDTFVPPVDSKTQALEIVSVTRRASFVRIKIKNGSDKNIHSLRMSYHKSGNALLLSFADLEKPFLAPGEAYKYDHAIFPNSPYAREPLTFEAVLFEDGTGDGEADKVKSLQDLYLASRKELEHVLALFLAAIDSPNVESLSNLRDLQIKVSQTPDYMRGVALNGLVGSTLNAWKATAMRFIEIIEQKYHENPGLKLQDELTQVKERFSKALAKYPGNR
jgi:hypothetical protein